MSIMIKLKINKEMLIPSRIILILLTMRKIYDMLDF